MGGAILDIGHLHGDSWGQEERAVGLRAGARSVEEPVPATPPSPCPRNALNACDRYRVQMTPSKPCAG